MASGAAGLSLTPSTASAVEIGPLNDKKRQDRAHSLRLQAADAQMRRDVQAHPTTSDDTIYPNFIGSFTKALPHNALGEVIPSAYYALLKAISNGTQSSFNAIPLGGTVRLANPQAAFSYSLEGADSNNHSMLAAPALKSAWCAGEMTEVYWRAWTRDIPFVDYATDNHIAEASSDLSGLSDFRAPTVSGWVTADTVFRGPTPGDLTGPMISQFLYKDIPFGATTIAQRYRTAVTANNHMTSFAHWLAVQNGSPAPTSATIDPTPRYIANGRDLAEYVHVDWSYQAFQSAALILLGFGRGALDDNNPYKAITNQGNFVTFGEPMILDLVARAGIAGLKAAWYQKWQVHRRLRPEAYAGLVHNHVTGATSYPLHADVLNSAVLPLIQGVYGTSLLPMAYPEGSPTHPAYPAGHATIAGACVTVLKAFFKESFAIPSPVQSDADGLNLVPFAGALTVGGELNKLASNISLGRDMGGVHWRSDGIEGMKLGEEVAIQLLRDHKLLNNESFTGFSLTRFDGSTVII
jgi:membrane-associated phospholipid phosphatase